MFARNRLTSSRERYAELRRRVAATPELALGGVTYGWLAAALRSIALTRRPGYLEAISTPILVCQAGAERVVSNRAQVETVRRLPERPAARVSRRTARAAARARRDPRSGADGLPRVRRRGHALIGRGLGHRQRLGESRHHRVEHGLGQPAGVHVVARGVKACREDPTVGQAVPCAVRERIGLQRQAQATQRRIVGDPAKRQHRPRGARPGQLAREEPAAGCDLGRRRLVLRRHAADRVGDAAAHQLKPVVRRGPIAATGEAVAEQRRIEDDAGEIARERPAGAVGAAQPGASPTTTKRAHGVAKCGHRGIEPIGCRRTIGRAKRL